MELSEINENHDGYALHATVKLRFPQIIMTLAGGRHVPE
jgi:hypothetical protein